MSISSIQIALPFCTASQEEQTKNSRTLRTLSVALGLIALLSGVFILSGISGFHTLGTTSGWALTTLGGCSFLIGSCVKCVKKEMGKQLNFRNKRQFQASFLDREDPLLPTDVPQLDSASQPSFEKVSTSASQLFFKRFGNDVCINIVSFLKLRDRFSLMTVSKIFCQAARSNPLWIDPDNSWDYRLHGGSPWYCKAQHSGYEADSRPTGFYFHQMRIYHGLIHEEELKASGGFLDYIARLMPGGPTAFQMILKRHVPDAARLRPSDMQGKQLMRGTDENHDHFFAMLVTNQANDIEPIVLVFTNAYGWKQKPNAYWQEENLLDDCFNYILSIIHGNVHTHETSKKTLKLADCG